MPERGDPERFSPLPPVAGLPRWVWLKLSPRGRRVTLVLGVAALAGLAIATPAVLRHGDDVADAERAREARFEAARRQQLIEDQRPRQAAIGAADVRAARRLGGMTDPSAAALLGTALESAITHDVRGRIQAGLLDGPARATDCTPVRLRTAAEAGYNCLTLSDRREFKAQGQISVGYRFLGRANLGTGLLVWCKENPQPLHPTSRVVKVRLAPACR